jgi:xanthine dehydrogenase accessory factor
VSDRLVVLRGAGDLGTGVAVRLWRAGFAVVALETAHPLAVRRTVSFSEAVFEGQAQVEEVVAVRVAAPEEALALLADDIVPVLVDPRGETIERLRPDVVVDAVLAKRNTGTHAEMARLVIGLGPGFTAGEDVHAVVETNRGPDLGRVYWRGTAQPNTGRPAEVLGHAEMRVLRAPADGEVISPKDIGNTVEAGEVIATVGGRSVCAAFPGVVRGILRSGTRVRAGVKIGDVDPRLDPTLCYRVSDKSLAIAGGVLEAVMTRRGARLS